METIYLGSWPQGNDGEIWPIAWYILAEERDRLLLHCTCGLQCMAYDSTGHKVFWETSTIRSWLNELYDKAFCSEEKEKVLEVQVENYRNLRQAQPERFQTTERLFLLSEDELRGFAFDSSAWIRKPSQWAVSSGAYADVKGNGVWWLRSYGRLEYRSMSVVRPDGVIYPSGDVRAKNVLICPALWIWR